MNREKLIDMLENEAMATNTGYVEVPLFLLSEILALLKEQEAVERTSRTGINDFSIIWTCGICGSDLHPNNAKAKFCSNCGQAVKWK